MIENYDTFNLQRFSRIRLRLIKKKNLIFEFT